MAQLDDLTNDSLIVLIAMSLMQESPPQMTAGEPDRLKEAMALERGNGACDVRGRLMGRERQGQ